jgi:hypothetical protein
MKHAVKRIHFVGIGHAGARAPASRCAAMPRPPGAEQVRR